jgi:predicted outer membrane repeat protein
MKKRNQFMLLLFGLLTFSSQSQTAVVNNPSDVNYVPGTLRYEIHHAVAGTTIYLTGLTSSINLHDSIIVTKNIKLVANNGMAVIDGNYTTNLLEVKTGVTLEMIGLTLQKGKLASGHTEPYNGQAVNVLGNLTSTNCTFKNNVSNYGGGAIAGTSVLSEIKLTDCVFENNDARSGGAIFIFAAKLRIQGSLFKNNRAVLTVNTSSSGGALTLSSADAYILNCTFIGNSTQASATLSGRGGAIYTEGNLNLEVSNSQFNGNIASGGQGGSGGAMHINSPTNYTYKFKLSNLTIANNYATGCGGIYAYTPHPFYIKNCIVAKNTALPGNNPDLYLAASNVQCVSNGGNLIGSIGVSPGTFTSSTNDLIGTNATPIDPLFIQLGSTPPSIDGDYHLNVCSPGINGGINANIPLDTYDYFGLGSTAPISKDLDGYGRMFQTVDKGAYEHPITVAGMFYYPTGHVQCKNAAPSSPNTGGASGTFTSFPAGLSINASTGVITNSSSAAGSYTIIFNSTSCTGVAASSAIVYSINPSPIVTITETISPSWPYSTTSLNAVISGTTGSHTYKWYRNGTYIGSASNFPSPCANATYMVVVTNTATGCQGSQSYFFNNSNNSVCSAQPPRELLAAPNLGETSNSKSRGLEVVSENWKLYPNPSAGEVFIELNDMYKLVQLEITDLTGKQVYTQTFTDCERLAVESHQPKGMYLVNLIADGMLKTYRLIIE